MRSVRSSTMGTTVKCGTRSAIERLLDNAVTAAIRDECMRGLEKLLPRQRLFDRRVVGTHHAKVGVAKQLAAPQRRPEARQKAYREIERARGEGIGDVLDI